VLSRLRRRDGIALPLTIFAVAIVTLMLSTVMVRVRTDLALAVSSSDVTEGLIIAQNGLRTYLASATERPADGDSIRINVQGGYAMVVAHLVQRPTDTLDNWRFVIRSTGYVIKPADGSDPRAIRTVAQFADWQHGAIYTSAALTAINGVDFSSSTQIVIDGGDDCSGNQITGLRAPSNSETPDPDSTYGSPPAKVQDTWSVVATETRVDWPAIVSGDFEADYETAIFEDTTYSSYLLEGNVYLENVSGTGLLIVTGELDTEGSYFRWSGIVLVGGKFDPDADSTEVRGMLVSGLNKTLGQPVGKNDFRDAADAVFLSYGSCDIDQTLDEGSGFIPMENTWMDNWATN
jgi:hypothetical protein